MMQKKGTDNDTLLCSVLANVHRNCSNTSMARAVALAGSVSLCSNLHKGEEL